MVRCRFYNFSVRIYNFNICGKGNRCKINPKNGVVHYKIFTSGCAFCSFCNFKASLFIKIISRCEFICIFSWIKFIISVRIYFNFSAVRIEDLEFAVADCISVFVNNAEFFTCNINISINRNTELHAFARNFKCSVLSIIIRA